MPCKELDGYFRVPHDGPPKWLAMYYAYLDETGQESKDWVYIAGFLGKEDHWREFIPAWEQGFQDSQRKHLHMRNLKFKYQTEKKLLEKLGPIPISCGLEALIGGVRVSDYADMLGGDQFQEKMHAGYVLALMPMLFQLCRWLPEDERVELIFEQQDRYAGMVNYNLAIITAFDELKTKDGKPKVASWKWVPKGSTSLTEPGDYFAYAISHYRKDQHSIESQWCLPILESVDTVRAIGAIVEREHIRQWMHLIQDKNKELTLPKSGEEFEKFRKLANEIIKVSHDELKTKLDLEREEKKRKKSKKSSA
jgi:hypothetical protein